MLDYLFNCIIKKSLHLDSYFHDLNIRPSNLNVVGMVKSMIIDSFINQNNNYFNYLDIIFYK